MDRNGGQGTGPHSTNNYTSLQLSRARKSLDIAITEKAKKEHASKTQGESVSLAGWVRTRRGIVSVMIPVTTFLDRQYERLKAEAAIMRARVRGDSIVAQNQLVKSGRITPPHPAPLRCKHGAAYKAL